jgi:hypothetical protein
MMENTHVKAIRHVLKAISLLSQMDLSKQRIMERIDDPIIMRQLVSELDVNIYYMLVEELMHHVLMNYSIARAGDGTTPEEKAAKDVLSSAYALATMESAEGVDLETQYNTILKMLKEHYLDKAALSRLAERILGFDVETFVRTVLEWKLEELGEPELSELHQKIKPFLYASVVNKLDPQNIYFYASFDPFKK